MATKKLQLRPVPRRKVLKTAGALGLAASIGPFFIARPAKAAKTLKILQWVHFVPRYDKWFNEAYIKEWGKQNDTEVIVDNISIAQINSRAAAEASAKQGHDMFMFNWPPPVYEDLVIDHAEIYQEVERKWGKPIDLAVKSTYNPKTNKYYGFSDSFVPDPINYRKDLWDSVGVTPDSWDNIRKGGAAIQGRCRYQEGAQHPGRRRAFGRDRHRHGGAHDHVLLRCVGAGCGRQPRIEFQ
jgi:multiple sugar transport system substrate-binding protein